MAAGSTLLKRRVKNGWVLFGNRLPQKSPLVKQWNIPSKMAIWKAYPIFQTQLDDFVLQLDQPVIET